MNQKMLDAYQSALEPDYYGQKQARSEAFFNYAGVPYHISARSLMRTFELLEDELQQKVTPESRAAMLQKCRQDAAKLVNAPDSKGVGFFRNTTEALNMAMWLSGMAFEKKGPPRHVMTTDSENPATYRTLSYLGDWSNVDKADRITTYPMFPWKRRMGYEPPEITPTGFDVHSFGVDFEGMDHIEGSIRRCIAEHKPKFFVLSHVLRTTGRLLPVERMTRIARDAAMHAGYKIIICVDGAQALGNVPQVDIQQMDCDFYISSAHKAMMSSPLGILSPSLPDSEVVLEWG